jgi:hypothetical protein
MSRSWMLALVWVAACSGRSKTPTVQIAAEPPADLTPTFVDLDLSSYEDEDDDVFDMAAMFREEADCGDLIALEPAALLGRLADEEVICLEDALAASERQTYMRKVSLLLMADAWAKEDSHRWATVAERHLERIDRSDPDICYKFSRYLAREGPQNAMQAIRWADVALENRTRFPPGDTTVARVYGLLKLKAVVSTQRWQQEESGYATAATDELDERREDARNEAKTMAREWLEFARDAGKDDTIAYQLCVAAAGGADYCSTS